MWLAVGFAARCARLVQPYFRVGYPKAPKNVLGDLERAITIAERFAAQGAGDPGYTADADGDHAVDIAGYVQRWAIDRTVGNYSDSAAGAAYAAGAAADIVEACSWANADLVYANATRAIRGALQCPEVATQIHNELGLLLARIGREPLSATAPFPAQWLSKSVS